MYFFVLSISYTICYNRCFTNTTSATLLNYNHCYYSRTSHYTIHHPYYYTNTLPYSYYYPYYYYCYYPNTLPYSYYYPYYYYPITLTLPLLLPQEYLDAEDPDAGIEEEYHPKKNKYAIPLPTAAPA